MWIADFKGDSRLVADDDAEIKVSCLAFLLK